MEDLVSLMTHKKFLNGNKPGTGKTPWCCVNIYRRWQDGIRTVLVMPKGLMGKNKREMHRFTPFRDDQVVIVDGTPKQVAKQLEGDPPVLLMGPARFRIIHKQLKKVYRAIDVDEFHLCFKTGDSQTTLAFLDFAKGCPEMNLMSGTFINGGLHSVWPAIHAVEPRYYPFGYRQFLARHAILDDYDRPIAWRGHDRLTEILSKHGCSRSFESIFGDNKPVIQLDLCEMSPKQKKLYLELEKSAMAELDQFMIDGTNPGIAMIRARQILDTPRNFPNLMDLDPKTKAVRSTIDVVDGELTGKELSLQILIEDQIRTGDNTLIFGFLTDQQREIVRLLNEWGRTAEHLGIDASAKERTAIDQRYVAGKTTDICTSAAIGSVGYNWQFFGPQKRETNLAIFAAVPYLDGDFVQAYHRAIRQKRQTPLRVLVQHYGTSVEDRLFTILERKSRDANLVDPDRPILKFDR